VVAGTTLDGVRLSTASLRGHVVVLTVWASWCAPCREESTVLAKLASAARPHGIRVLGLDENDTTEQATAFAHRAGAEYPSLVDDGTRMRALTRWLPPAVPGTLVVDPRGRVAARVVGAVRAGVLDPVLADLSRG
jgi:thiol-disulfide isomerase/thioredoxin